MTTITNDNIRTLVVYYLRKKTQLPPDLANVSIGLWDTSNVTSMNSLFAGEVDFNEDISGWDTSNVTDMFNMFAFCESFNQPLNNWNVSKVTNMKRMFVDCFSFNQPLNNWDVSNVTTMSEMFAFCNIFNQPLSLWNTSNVTDMKKMFAFCTAFNQPLNSWDTSNVTNMSNMFAMCSAFNQPLNFWNTANVINMVRMFWNTTNFNQNLSMWDINPNSDFDDMFQGSAIVEDNMPQAIIEARPRRRQRVNVNAMEIHNEFGKINKDNLQQIFATNNQNTSNTDWTLINVFYKMSEVINAHFFDNVKLNYLRDLQRVLTKAQEAFNNPVNKRNYFINESLNLAFSLPADFQEAYVRAFIEDCAKAYSPNADTNTNVDLTSCVGGIMERFVMSLGDAAFILCPEYDTCTNELYKSLLKVIRQVIDMNAIAQKWATERMELPEVQAKSTLDRKQDFIDFAKSEFAGPNQVDNKTMEIINNYANKISYVFEQQEMAFGGKIRKRRVTKRRRQTKRKYSNKRKQTKRKYSNKRKQTNKRNYLH